MLNLDAFTHNGECCPNWDHFQEFNPRPPTCQTSQCPWYKMERHSRPVNWLFSSPSKYDILLTHTPVLYVNFLLSDGLVQEIQVIVPQLLHASHSGVGARAGEVQSILLFVISVPPLELAFHFGERHMGKQPCGPPFSSSSDGAPKEVLGCWSEDVICIVVHYSQR